MNSIFIIPISILLCSANCYSQVWNSMGNEFQNNNVFALEKYNNTLYAGGTYYSTTSNLDNIAYWNGAQWSPMGPGMLGGVNCMTFYNNQLHIAGAFHSIGGNSLANCIARWDGSNWINLEAGITNGTVKDIAVFNGELYVVGGILAIDSIGMIDIGKWNGNSWTPVCTMSGGLSTLYATAVFNGELYIGGYFSSVNGQPMLNIARFNGSMWNDVGGGVIGDVFDMFADTVNNRLYVTGNIVSLNGNIIPCPTNVAYWDGSTWNAVGSDPAMYPNSIYQYKNETYVGFIFPRVKTNGDTLHYIAKWNGNEWQNLGSGVNSSVHTLVEYNGDLIVAGNFTEAGSAAANRVAAWSDSTTSISYVESELSEIKIYPNPINNHATIQLSESYKQKLPANLELYDMQGKKVYKIEIKELIQEFDLMLQNGSYIYKIYDNKIVMKTGQISIAKSR